MASRRTVLFALALGLVTAANPVRADDVLDARHTMEEAAIAVDRLRQETSKSGELDNLLRDAKGVLIIPSFYKAGFFIGGAYGDGVLLKRVSATEFGDPAFYRMTAGSLGLQFGMQSAQIVFVIRTEKGLAAVLNDEFKMGANASIAVGSIGAGAEAATTTHVGKDIIAYSKNSGLFAGGAFEGAAIKPRRDWNAAVYGVDKADPRLIIQRSGLRAALNLKDTLNRGAAGAKSTMTFDEGAGAASTAPAQDGFGTQSPAQSPAQSPGAVTSQPLSSPVQSESMGGGN